MGHFDLDPATPEVMPWQTAANRYTEKDNGLMLPDKVASNKHWREKVRQKIQVYRYRQNYKKKDYHA